MCDSITKSPTGDFRDDLKPRSDEVVMIFGTSGDGAIKFAEFARIVDVLGVAAAGGGGSETLLVSFFNGRRRAVIKFTTAEEVELHRKLLADDRSRRYVVPFIPEAAEVATPMAAAEGRGYKLLACYGSNARRRNTSWKAMEVIEPPERGRRGSGSKGGISRAKRMEAMRKALIEVEPRLAHDDDWHKDIKGHHRSNVFWGINGEPQVFDFDAVPL